MIRPKPDLFSKAEHLLLSTWLKKGPPVRLDPKFTVEQALAELGFDDCAEFPAIDHAIGSIVLKTTVDELPSWSTVERSPEKFVTSARSRVEQYPSLFAELKSRLAFSINWATSGPGYDWPEAYYVSWVPSYESFVVTVSVDSADTWGGNACDAAIGAFEKCTDQTEPTQALVTAYLRSRRERNTFGKWQAVTNYGILSPAHVQEIESLVWPDDNGSGYAAKERT